MYGNGMENVVSRVLSRNLTYIRRQMLFRQIIMIITFVLIHAWNINSIGICWSLIMSLYLMKFHMRSHSDQTLSPNFRRFSTGSTLYICSNIHRFNKTGEQLCHFTHHSAKEKCQAQGRVCQQEAAKSFSTDPNWRWCSCLEEAKMWPMWLRSSLWEGTATACEDEAQETFNGWSCLWSNSWKVEESIFPTFAPFVPHQGPGQGGNLPQLWRFKPGRTSGNRHMWLLWGRVRLWRRL